MWFNRVVFAIVALVPALASGQAAQAPDWPISASSRVKVLSPVFGDRLETATVVSSSSDSLVLQLMRKDAKSVALSTANIARLEVARGQHTSTRKDALIGLLVGAGSGAILGAATYQKPHCKNPGWCGGGFDLNRGGSAALVGGLGGILGALAGAVLGARETDSWVVVALPASR